MRSNDLVSVIVPIYGVEEYLEKCVNSIIRQTYKNLEIILVDDGSRDACPGMCDDFAKNDCRVVVIHKKNGGQAEARNFGIDVAKGDYLAFVDGDDWIENTMIEHLLETCKKYDVPVSTCGRYLTDGNSVKGVAFTGQQAVCSSEVALKEILSGKSMDVAPFDKIYKREVFNGVRFPVGEVNEDIAIFYKLVDNAQRVAHSGTVEYYYRNRPGSTTKLAYNYKVRKIIEKNLDSIEEYVDDKYPSCKQSFNRYKAINIYALLNKYIKCVGTKKTDEYKYLMRKFWNNRKYFFGDEQTNVKDKVIAVLIILNLYNPYLMMKKMVIGHK